MASNLHRLSAKFVETTSEPKRHADGGNLYLDVKPSGAKSWAFMWNRAGRQREMGLGAYPAVSLKAARERAKDCRQSLVDGKDPLDERKRATPGVLTFGQVADELIEAKSPGWRNAAHRQQWKRTLGVDAAPIRGMPVNAITTNDVYVLLAPLWNVKQATALKLRGRIEAVLDAAKARGLRAGENPAAWRGNLKNLLATPQKLQDHHTALPYEQVPALVVALRKSPAIAARALEFVIATAARKAEVIGARWDEVDVENGTWLVPAARMKGGLREHRKPLSEHAMLVIGAMQAVRHNEFVFPGAKPGTHLTDEAIKQLLIRFDVDATAHGFRSSFADWAAEETSFPNLVSEIQLAHQVGSEVERAYRRGDLFAKRRELMAAWSSYCLGGN